MGEAEKVKLGTALSRGLRLRCPRCGTGRIFRRAWTYSEYPECPACGLRFDPKGETLAFMYLSTAFITGLGFIVLVVMPPRNLAIYRVVLIACVLFVYGVTMPARKGVAIALHYFINK